MGAKLDKVKKHVKDNKKVYIAGGVGVVMGAAVATVVLLKSRINVEAAEAVIVNAPTAVGWNNTQTIINLIERSTPSKPVHLKGTNLYFNSMSEAARETGHSVSDISKNVRGLRPDVKGDIFELLERAA